MSHSAEKDVLTEVQAAIMALATAYQGSAREFSGPEVAEDLRALASMIDNPTSRSRLDERTARRAARTVRLVECPRCGRQPGGPCANLSGPLDEPPRDRVLPHPERDAAARTRVTPPAVGDDQ